MTLPSISDVARSRKPWDWARTLQDQAVANARAASTECSRRRVERAEVAHCLATRTESPSVVAQRLG